MRLILALLLAPFLLNPSYAVVGIQDRQGIKITAQNLKFTDEQGTPVVLDQYFHQGRPIALAFVYFECPGACTVLLTGMVNGLKQLVKVPGKSFDIVVVSIDPSEDSTLAKKKKETYLQSFSEGGPEAIRRQNTDSGWHFLTGTIKNISELSSQLGFQYERDQNGVYIHPSALFILTPDGVLSSTLMGITFPKKELNLALSQAASGQLGFVQKIAYICYAYLPHVGWLNSPLRWLSVISLTLLLGGFFIFTIIRFKIAAFTDI